MSQVTTGLEKLADGAAPELHGKRLGLVTNPCGVDRHLRSSIDVLFGNRNIDLVALFGPEHGIRGEVQAGGKVDAEQDNATGLPVHSLYGKTRMPDAAMLDGLDAVVVDLQDIGVRYATYLSTLDNVLTACHANSKQVIILDRPNPLGGQTVSGGLLDPGFRSFIGTHPVPILHGMTLGELGLMIAHERALTPPIVVTMDGWRRSMLWDETGLPWVLPSPNLPTLDSHLLYPATCLIEGTTLSEGRGTTRPFEVFGAPWLNPQHMVELIDGLRLPGVRARPHYFVPTISKHAGEHCGGVQVYVERGFLHSMPELGSRLIHLLATNYSDQFAWTDLPDEGSRYFIDLLTGNDQLRNAIDAGESPDDLLDIWTNDAETFRVRRGAFLLYDS
ncbi:MAG: DUF1343 domain-containing protein [Thermomicrobiales bacterium]